MFYWTLSNHQDDIKYKFQNDAFSLILAFLEIKKDRYKEIIPLVSDMTHSLSCDLAKFLT